MSISGDTRLIGGLSNVILHRRLVSAVTEKCVHCCMIRLLCFQLRPLRSGSYDSGEMYYAELRAQSLEAGVAGEQLTEDHRTRLARAHPIGGAYALPFFEKANIQSVHLCLDGR